jgi:hypothetical protein
LKPSPGGEHLNRGRSLAKVVKLRKKVQHFETVVSSEFISDMSSAISHGNICDSDE